MFEKRLMLTHNILFLMHDWIIVFQHASFSSNFFEENSIRFFEKNLISARSFFHYEQWVPLGFSWTLTCKWADTDGFFFAQPKWTSCKQLGKQITGKTAKTSNRSGATVRARPTSIRSEVATSRENRCSRSRSWFKKHGFWGKTPPKPDGRPAHH